MKKSCSILVLIAILVSCSTQPIPDTKESLKPKEEVVSKPSNSPIPIPIASSSISKPIESSSPINENKKLFLLTAEDIKKVTDSKLVQANNSFGTKLFLNIAKEDLKKNTFISPTSASIALQMAYNGSDTTTKDEMKKALEINNISLEELNSLNKLLNIKLSNPASDITLNVANSLWADNKRIEIKEKFKTDLETFYNATAQSLDFSDSNSANIINKWCEDKTNGKIKDVVNPKEFNPDSTLLAYLINAIYFKADWKEKFKKESTQPNDFTLLDGTKVKKDFMYSFRNFGYYSSSNKYINGQIVQEENKFELAKLDYGKDGKLSLYIFLPDSTSSLDKFYTYLTGENIDNWIGSVYSGEGNISFPKFKMKEKYNLIPSLKKQGMNLAFVEGKSDFKNLGIPKGSFDPSIIYISKVNQDVFVDVNEEGSEAAAVTSISFAGSTSSGPSNVLRFVADRPFFYIIRDNETKSNLFMGSIVNPEYK